MSTWTHVVGAFRADGIPPMMPNRKRDIENILGLICTWEEERPTTMPCGSEGSLQYKIHEYGTGLPWMVITVWGDLRDYSDVEAIIKWWNDVLLTIGGIRDAVITVKCNETVKTVAHEN